MLLVEVYWMVVIGENISFFKNYLDFLAKIMGKKS